MGMQKKGWQIIPLTIIPLTLPPFSLAQRFACGLVALGHLRPNDSWKPRETANEASVKEALTERCFGGAAPLDAFGTRDIIRR